jgi:hypothetical protein
MDSAAATRRLRTLPAPGLANSEGRNGDLGELAYLYCHNRWMPNSKMFAKALSPTTLRRMSYNLLDD